MKTVIVRGSRQTRRSDMCVELAMQWLQKNPQHHLVYVSKYPGIEQNIFNKVDEIVNRVTGSVTKSRVEYLHVFSPQLDKSNSIEGLNQFIRAIDGKITAFVFEVESDDCGEYLLQAQERLPGDVNLLDMDVVFLSKLNQDEEVEFSDLTVIQL